MFGRARAPWTQQPYQGALIDWSNPITVGLVSLIDSSGVETLRRQTPSTATSTRGSGSVGSTEKFTSSQYSSIPVERVSGLTGLSMMYFGDWPATSANNSFYFAFCDASGATYDGGLYSSGSGSNKLSFFVGTTPAGISGTSSATTPKRGLVHIGTYDGATVRNYVNGRIDEAVNRSGSFPNTGLPLVTNKWNGASGVDLGSFIRAVWNRVLSPSEVSAITANPWQLFQRRAIIFSPGATGGPDVTVGISGVGATSSAGALSSSLGLPISGVVGSASAGALVANLSLAATGVAGSASVGSLAAAISVALSGLGATGGVGTVTASTAGDITVSVSGVSATVSAGTVVPALSLTVSGNSASASAGSVTRSQSVGLTGAGATGFAGSVTASGGVVQVRTKGLRKTRYTPGRVPANQQGLAQFLQAELERLTDGLESPFTHQILEKLNVEPSRKLGNTALIAYADGTNWDPGSGEGVYAYYGGAWHKLG